MSGHYPASSSLRQDALAKDFGTSRIPVREALFLLEGDGLIEFKPHKGAVVKPLSVDEASELFHLRAVLEGDLLRRAIPNMTEDDLIQAGKALVDYDRAVFSGKNIGRWFQLNWLFHSAIYHPARSDITLNIVKSLHANTDRYQRIQIRLQGAAPRAHNQHLEILEHCRKKQIGKAVDLMEMHILDAGHQVTDFLNKDNG